MLSSFVARYKKKKKKKRIQNYFRGDAAFANPEVYEYLEGEGIQGILYAIQLPANDVLLREMAELKKALAEEWNKTPAKDPTQVFLDKCGGWEDTRSPEEIIAGIYASRTISLETLSRY